jgi:cytochrome c oxidase cbb3-type subunit 3
MTRAPILCGLLLAVALTGCEREARKFHEPEAMNRPAAGGAQNPDLAPGTTKPPTQPLQMSADDPYENNAFMVGQGQSLYLNMNCAGCHAMGGGGMGPALMDDEWVYGSKGSDIFTSIVEGRPNGMPSYRGKLTVAGMADRRLCALHERPAPQKRKPQPHGPHEREGAGGGERAGEP